MAERVKETQIEGAWQKLIDEGLIAPYWSELMERWEYRITEKAIRQLQQTGFLAKPNRD